ncbi:MATH domain and coiled-coil domain-containing protein At3g58440-like isoform X2 [Chenopodium quinoa]|uniref:MATH domain and coiled-coil domain-containing protein At3g58440-like isoform X2 n=1 Tax=Chenopodium quinoa TaxID=63459 RepID=UPI000B77D27C|nr:MATH domain and coiled-coil domain-containing protein At3g58440-like isoform X2 [Chenopodium quinoa]
MSIVEGKIHRSYTWSIEKFSTLNDELFSPVFRFDGWSWKLNLFPRGEAEDGKCLSLFLHVDNSSGLTDDNKLYVEFILYLKNQRQGKDDHHTYLVLCKLKQLGLPILSCLIKFIIIRYGQNDF